MKVKRVVWVQRIVRMAALGFAVETDRYGSVLGTRQGNRPGPTVLLDAHLDTVPVTRPEAWTQDPYGAALHEGRLWGRGAADTKGSLAAMLCAAAALTDFPGTVHVSASVGEEDLTAAALSHVLDRHPADLVEALGHAELRRDLEGRHAGAPQGPQRRRGRIAADHDQVRAQGQQALGIVPHPGPRPRLHRNR